MVKVTGISKGAFAEHREDMYFDEVLIDDEPAGSGGGDFSTAQVEIINRSGNGFQGFIQMVCVLSEEGYPDYLGFPMVQIQRNNSQTFTAVLYQDETMFYLTDANFEVEGNAALDDYGGAVITGDCKITITRLNTLT